MHTEEEYQQVTNERLDQMGYTHEGKKSIQMLLYWSYLEGGRDSDKDSLASIKGE